VATNDGGPAFPSPLEWREERNGATVSGVFDNGHDGMMLRDYFAAKALPEAVRQWRGGTTKDLATKAASLAYEIADAMLKARGEKGSTP
jgi:hypothetical protein